MSEIVLSCSDLSVAYGGVKAVNNVDLEVRAGEVVGLIGPNGAGKTSLLDAISGFTPMTGQLELGGVAIDRVAPHRRRHLGLSRTWQSVEVFDDLSLIENVTVTVGRRSGSERDSRHLGRVQDGMDKLSLVGLAERADSLPGELSHGQRVLIGVARALVGSPRVLLMDEPAAGLDDGESDALRAVVRDVAAQGVAVVLIDHDMGLIMAACDRLHVLDFGSTIASGLPEEVANDPRVVAAYLGTSTTQSDDEDVPSDD